MLDSVLGVEGALRRNPQALSIVDDESRPKVPQPQVASADEGHELARRMPRLSPRDRWLLFLCYTQRLSVAEIARLLGLSRVGCYRIRGRALVRLIGDDSLMTLT